jgi:DNA adenine methylase
VPYPTEILKSAFEYVSTDITKPVLRNADIVNSIEYVCRFINNRACVRLLLACSLAKSHNPGVDIRKPYTEIGDSDSYSGRTYDERYVASFIIDHKLPCNPTTAFLTPAFRNRNITLTPEINLVGRPPKLYLTTLQILTDIHIGKVAAEEVLAETIRWLLVVRDENLLRMNTMLANLKSSEDIMPLSSEAIVVLIEQHLKCQNASRLPVLVVAAAYQAASKHLGEHALPLKSHNAADEQTGALGDVQITFVGDDNVITVYEMKTKRIIQNDIDYALQKIDRRIDNYIFITTEPISEQVKDYAASIYEKTEGIEFVVLDCIGFLRHFIHLFHRLRMQFLESYQELVLMEPESAVRRPLKEAFLALRLAAESANVSDDSVNETHTPRMF